MTNGNPNIFDLTGRVSLITGGTRGLGRQMAEGFARAGSTVVIASRKADACTRVAAEISGITGATVLGHPCHVGHWQELEELVAFVQDQCGPIDVLVNNAGMSPTYVDLTSVTEELMDKVLDVNLKGPFRLAALVGTSMQLNSGGSIINISSAGAVHPRPSIVPYAAAKAGLNAMTVGMAHAFGPTVRVNAIMAGTFMTDISDSWDADVFAERAQTFALQRGGQPHEIVGAALYLASSASSYTTGSILTVDGGQP